jgi:rare lipoprotein A (peptidoglycan hydrolase)
LLINIVVTAALVPMLFPSHEGGSDTAVAAGAGSFEPRLVWSTASTMLLPTTTTTTTAPPPPTTAAAKKKKAAPTTTTTAKPKPKPAPATTVPPAAPRPAAATQPPPPPTGSESGKATWYDYKPGICAHKTLPFGTVVTVHAVNGKSVQCTVGDRGPFVEGYVIDLNAREFEQLAPTSQGRIDCTITW